MELDDTLIRLYNKSEGMVTQLEIILNHSPGELQRALDLMHTQTEILKAGFASFKEAWVAPLLMFQGRGQAGWFISSS